MATSRGRRAAPDYVPEVDEDAETAYSRVGFAAIMLGLAGCWNIFEGIAAVYQSRVYTADATYVFSDLRTWGWIVLALGILLLLAAGSLLKGGQVARWFAICVAGLNAIGQLMFIHSNPFWGLAMFTVDLLVIYALAVYGGVARSSD
jgi:hypothetical protein